MVHSIWEHFTPTRKSKSNDEQKDKRNEGNHILLFSNFLYKHVGTFLINNLNAFPNYFWKLLYENSLTGKSLKDI